MTPSKIFSRQLIVRLAQGFRHVRYSYHREFFELLGYPKIAARFADIWDLCEPYMKEEPHEALVNGQAPYYWLAFLDHPDIHHQFLMDISNVLEQEALSDERRGRGLLARKLHETVKEIRLTAHEKTMDADHALNELLALVKKIKQMPRQSKRRLIQLLEAAYVDTVVGECSEAEKLMEGRIITLNDLDLLDSVRDWMCDKFDLPSKSNQELERAGRSKNP